MTSSPQTYTISDFIEWHSKKQLVLDPDFQRGNVWNTPARVFLIDTILNDLPIPQIYFRTKLDTENQTTIREVVDGQQRLRAILDFSSGKLRLTSKSPRFSGKTYKELEEKDKNNFLSYKIPVVQLLNATDADVLEVFARLNSYSVKVTPAELRHAEFSEPVKWAIYDAARDWSILWTDLKVVGTRDTVRLRHTSLIAEMFMTLDHGLGDGGEAQITKYYKNKIKEDESYFSMKRSVIDDSINEIISNTGDILTSTKFYDGPNFLMLFAAVCFLNGKIPKSNIPMEVIDCAGRGVNWEAAREKLTVLAQYFDDDNEKNGPYADFIAATKSTTHRIASRKIRFKTLVKLMVNDAPLS